MLAAHRSCVRGLSKMFRDHLRYLRKDVSLERLFPIIPIGLKFLEHIQHSVHGVVISRVWLDMSTAISYERQGRLGGHGSSRLDH